MEFHRIPHKEKKSQLTIAKIANAKLVNPIEKTMNDIINTYKSLQLSTYEFAYEHNKPSPLDTFSRNDILTYLELEGLKIWKEQYNNIMKSNLSESIFQILNCTDKDLQIQIFKSPFELTTLSMQKFIFKAWELYGFKYSDYRFEHLQKGLNSTDLPKGLIITKENNVEVFGKTELKDGILRNAILHRKVTIAKFLDKDSEWHCFYYTYNSINGKESGEIPHIHYISNNWTISRKIVVEELSKRHHSFTSSVHVNYKRHS